MTHTAGPWKVSSFGEIYSEALPKSDCVLADTYSKPEDAALMAAAPELLHAAHIALTMMGGDDSGPDDEDMADVWAKVRAAVDKAHRTYRRTDSASIDFTKEDTNG